MFFKITVSYNFCLTLQPTGKLHSKLTVSFYFTVMVRNLKEPKLPWRMVCLGMDIFVTFELSFCKIFILLYHSHTTRCLN